MTRASQISLANSSSTRWRGEIEVAAPLICTALLAFTFCRLPSTSALLFAAMLLANLHHWGGHTTGR